MCCRAGGTGTLPAPRHDSAIAITDWSSMIDQTRNCINAVLYGGLDGFSQQSLDGMRALGFSFTNRLPSACIKEARRDPKKRGTLKRLNCKRPKRAMIGSVSDGIWSSGWLNLVAG